jgi:SulP family sulfate permease
MLGSYKKSWFRLDLFAGLTVWAMVVPQALGYSSLAGMPTVNGLYAAIAAMLIYWLWGSSRELNVGPESTVAIMVATVLTPMASPGSEEYVNMAAMLGILVGLVLLLGGVFRLGRIADFLSRPILAGYVFGSGLLIITSQLADLTGIDVDQSLYATDVGSIVRNLDMVDWATLLMGLGTIAVVVIFKRFSPAVPGALVAVALATAIAYFAELDIAVVGDFASGLPIPAIPSLTLSQVGALIGPAFAIALLVYPDSVLTGRSLATVNKYRLDPNREFFGIGAANIGAGFLQGFPVNGSQSRSFVMSDAKGKSQVANLWAAGFTILTLLFLAPVVAELPLAALAGVVIVAGFGLLDLAEFKALWRYRKIEFWLGIVTVAAVVFLGMLVGILIAIGLSLLVIVLQASSPHTAVLGRLPGSDTYRDVADHPDAVTFPGLVIFRFDAPLFFANAGRFREEVTDALEAADQPVTDLVLDLEVMYDIDATGAQTLLELVDDLAADGIKVSVARVRTEIRDEMVTAGIEGRLGIAEIRLEVDDCVADYLSRHPDAAQSD